LIFAVPADRHSDPKQRNASWISRGYEWTADIDPHV